MTNHEGCKCWTCATSEPIDGYAPENAYRCSKCGCPLDERHAFSVNDFTYCQDCIEDMNNAWDEL